MLLRKCSGPYLEDATPQFQALNPAFSSATLHPRFSALSCSSGVCFFDAVAGPAAVAAPFLFWFAIRRDWAATARRSRSYCCVSIFSGRRLYGHKT